MSLFPYFIFPISRFSPNLFSYSYFSRTKFQAKYWHENKTPFQNFSSALYFANKTRTTSKHSVQNNYIISLIAVGTFSYAIFVIGILHTSFSFGLIKYACTIPVIKTVYKCGRVKLLGRVLKKSGKVICRVLK